MLIAGDCRAFIVQVPLTLLGFINVYFALEQSPEERTFFRTRKLRRIDFGGALLLITAVCTLLVGLDQGANVSWRLPTTIVCLSISLPLFTIFLLTEVKIASDPFLPRHVIFNGSLLACSLCNFFAFGAYMALTYNLPLYWQAVEHLSATQSAIRLLPIIVANVLGSLFAGVVRRNSLLTLRILC